MIDHLTHLFKYNRWATERTADSILKCNAILPEAVKLLSHIVSAQYVWLSRIKGEKSDISPWDNFTTEECINKSKELTGKWISLFDAQKDNFVEERIKYENTRGEKFESSILDICTHVINHSTYHRAQIAKIVKDADGKPAATDYIVYQREQQN